MKYVIVAVLIILILTYTFKRKLKDEYTFTYRHGVSHNESYPTLLSSLSGHKVINAGINGETSDDGLQRLPKLLEDKSIKLMILCFGGNDILRKKSMQSLKQNLKIMIQMAKEKEIEVLLISVPNISLFGLSPLELYEEIAEEEEIPLVRGILAETLGNPTLKSDQIHPNSLGYKQMAKEIHQALKENGWIK